MVHKHISRDYTPHEKEVIRPSDDYVMFEIRSYDPAFTKIYIPVNNPFKTSNATKSTWKSWNCYKATDGNKSMQFTFNYNFKESGVYHIEFVYEQNSYIHSNKKYNTSDNLMGGFKTYKDDKLYYDVKVMFDGENNIIKRVHSYRRYDEGTQKIVLTIPPNVYFYGLIIRKEKYYFGDNLDSADSNLMFTSATLSKSSMTQPSELSVTIGYDSAFECFESPSGFYMDYMDECNLYVKDDNGVKQRVFGGYLSSILPDADRTKLTVSCADRLRDGSNKYILDEMVLQGGTKSFSDNDYIESMEIDFDTYAKALKYICNTHETTLKSNISKNYLVDGEKFNDGVVLTFGKKKKIKNITTSYCTHIIYDNFIMVRNNSESVREQVFDLYEAKDHTKKPLDLTDTGYFHVTYGLGEPKTEIKSKETTTAENSAGAQKFTKCGVSADGKYIMAIGLPSAPKDSKKGFTKAVFERRCPYCGSKELYWGFMWSGNFPCTKRFNNGSAGRYEGHIYCDSCDMDFSVQGWEHIVGSNRRLKLVSSVVSSSREEANKLKNGHMVAVPTSAVATTSDDVFKDITKIAFKYRYKIGTTSSYNGLKKSGSGDCWAFSDLIYSELKKRKITCKVVQYSTSYSNQHRSVMYMNDKGQWVDFPYREYGWNTHFNNMLNNTSASKSASAVQTYNGNTIGKAISSSSSSQSTTSTVTITNGYDKDKPIQCFFEITYSTSQSFTAKKHKFYIDFTQQASQDISISGMPAFWINKATRKSSVTNINFVDFLRSLSKHSASDRFYLQSVRMITPKKKQEEGKDNDWYKYDDSTIDNSSCKMDLYQIAFNNNAGANPSELNSCGKTVNAMLEQLVKESGYLVDIKYGNYRRDDVINFRLDNDTKVRFTATEGDDNNILSWGNISYTPVSTLFNLSMQVYKSFDDKYHYVDTKDADSILKYQEQCTLATSTDKIGSKEAYWNAMQAEKYNPVQTYSFTVTVPNYPHLRLGDLVKVVANAKKLNTIKTVKSIKISYDISHMPRIQTELGLDELSPDIQMKENIRNLRKNAKAENTYFSSSAIPVSDETVYEWDN